MINREQPEWWWSLLQNCDFGAIELRRVFLFREAVMFTGSRCYFQFILKRAKSALAHYLCNCLTEILRTAGRRDTKSHSRHVRIVKPWFDHRGLRLVTYYVAKHIQELVKCYPVDSFLRSGLTSSVHCNMAGSYSGESWSQIDAAVLTPET